jgi:predicted GNAT family N-acyltransferase
MSNSTNNNHKAVAAADDDVVDQSWDDVIATTRVVATREEALACARLSTGGNMKSFAWKSLKRFWRWHWPLLACTFLVLEAIRMLVLLSTLQGGNLKVTNPLWFVVNLMLRDFIRAIGVSLLQSSFSNDSDGGVTTFMMMMMRNCFRIVFGVLGRFILVTIVLMIFRIYQRLSWRTTELGTFPSVKDDVRYQDEQLLAKAWNMASIQHGYYKDPTQCDDYEEGVGGGAVVMQPCPGYCGIATLNSTLRSFGGSGNARAAAGKGKKKTTTTTNDPPYLSLHSHTRYVTLEEMCRLVQEKVINRSKASSSSEWESGGGGRVESMQVIGGGRNGLKCLEQFKAALRQLSHPTQPARIMAIYHRSPLFFCSNDKSLTSKLACFPMVHWSPVLAYLEEEDLVLVMDVNHMYGPKGYLVSTQRFLDAVNTRDIFNGNFHGLILLRPPPPRNTGPPLLTSPRDLSVVFGGIKQAYYRHQAAGRKASASEILLSNDDGYSPLKDNEQGEKSIRMVSTEKEEPNTTGTGLSAVLSGHPVFFSNEIFLDCTGRVPSPEAVRTMMNVFAKLRLPPRVAVRGLDASTARDMHRILTAAGMIQFFKGTKVMFLNLEPAPRNYKSSTDKLPQGYFIQEIIFHPGKGQDSPAVADLGKLIVESYKFPTIFRRGQSPSDFYAQTYQTFEHGGKTGLRHFGCYERESGTLAACVALFCDCTNSSTTSRPDVAALYNVCTSPQHRHKGLGRAMTLHAMEVAKNEMGVQQIVLEASPAGQPLYESMGFVVVNEPLGGVYVSLSTATDDFKWKNGFRLLELYYRVKNGGMWFYYTAEAMRQLGISKRRP